MLSIHVCERCLYRMNGLAVNVGGKGKGGERREEWYDDEEGM